MLVAHLGDLVADPDEGAQDALLAHDAGVVSGVGGSRHEFGQGMDELAPARSIEHAIAFELRTQRDHVDLLATVVEREHGSVDQAMGVSIEVVSGQQLSDGGDGVGVDQHRPKHRLLRLEIVRGQ